MNAGELHQQQKEREQQIGILRSQLTTAFDERKTAETQKIELELELSRAQETLILTTARASKYERG
jgi:hypothetical protein